MKWGKEGRSSRRDTFGKYTEERNNMAMPSRGPGSGREMKLKGLDCEGH